jgi:hypothetical protein
MISFPCAFNSLAKAAIASVCDVARLLILSESGLFIKKVLKAPNSYAGIKGG